MDGLENGHVEGILLMNEGEYAANTNTKKKQEWEAGGRCRWWRVVTCLVRRHLSQAIRMLQHAHCINNFAKNKTNRIGKNAGGEQIDAEQCLTDLAASTRQPTCRQLVRIMSGGEKDRAVWVKCDCIWCKVGAAKAYRRWSR
jgi:hypothetical protein